METREDKERRLKQKADFYFREKCICHITKEPRGSVNGWFRSELIDDLYYMFEGDWENAVEEKLFLCDIFEIKDWKVKE